MSQQVSAISNGSYSRINLFILYLKLRSKILNRCIERSNLYIKCKDASIVLLLGARIESDRINYAELRSIFRNISLVLSFKKKPMKLALKYCSLIDLDDLNNSLETTQSEEKKLSFQNLWINEGPKFLSYLKLSISINNKG